MTVIEPAAGTDESGWAAWGEPAGWPVVDLGALARRPVLVVAAHPDDEVLGVGGLLAGLADLGADVRLLWATDGEASHPGSTADLAARLAGVRRAEAEAAMAALGLGSAAREHLGLPDGGLPAREDRLAAALADRVGPDDVLLAPWAGDGHPDHEACGRAARRAASTAGASLLEYPVWAWHWAEPADPRIPWSRARRADLGAEAVARKAGAIECFRSQVGPIGPAPEDAAVLPERVLAHFRRHYEVVLG